VRGVSGWRVGAADSECCSACRAFYDRALAIDVREYAPYVVAEVTVNADSMKDANSKGFRQVPLYPPSPPPSPPPPPPYGRQRHHNNLHKELRRWAYRRRPDFRSRPVTKGYGGRRGLSALFPPPGSHCWHSAAGRVALY